MLLKWAAVKFHSRRFIFATALQLPTVSVLSGRRPTRGRADFVRLCGPNSLRVGFPLCLRNNLPTNPYTICFEPDMVRWTQTSQPWIDAHVDSWMRLDPAGLRSQMFVKTLVWGQYWDLYGVQLNPCAHWPWIRLSLMVMTQNVLDLKTDRQTASEPFIW